MHPVKRAPYTVLVPGHKSLFKLIGKLLGKVVSQFIIIFIGLVDFCRAAQWNHTVSKPLFLDFMLLTVLREVLMAAAVLTTEMLYVAILTLDFVSVPFQVSSSVAIR